VATQAKTENKTPYVTQPMGWKSKQAKHEQEQELQGHASFLNPSSLNALNFGNDQSMQSFNTAIDDG
jgi:hypothetical protein